MKLIPRAKPVKIRIISGGEEHTSLDSLQRSFNWADIQKVKANGSLEKWLRSIGENEIADDFKERGNREIKILEVYNMLFNREIPFTEDIQVYQLYGQWSEGTILEPLVKELSKDLSYDKLIKITRQFKQQAPILRGRLVSLAEEIIDTASPKQLFEIGEYLFSTHKGIAINFIQMAAEKENSDALGFIEKHKQDFLGVDQGYSETIAELILAYREVRDKILLRWGTSENLKISCQDKYEKYIVDFCNTCNAALWNSDHTQEYRDARTLGSAFFGGLNLRNPLYILYAFVKALFSPYSTAIKILEGISTYPPAKEMLTPPGYIYHHREIWLQVGNAAQNKAQLKKLIEELDYFLSYVKSVK